MSIAIFSAPAPAAFSRACSARSRQRQPAADRHRVRDRRKDAAIRAVRRGDHSRAAGVRRHASAARAECGARWRAAVRGAADHSRQTDPRDLSPVARRIFPGRSDRSCDHRAADRTRRRGRHRAVAAARHLEHDAGAADPVRRVPDTTIWWPESPHLPGERHPDIAVVGLQAPLSFLNAQNFRADVLEVVKRAKPLCWCWKPAA